MTERDYQSNELADILTEWRKTCAQMGLPFTLAGAAGFAVDAGFRRPETHVRESTDLGPDFCATCSRVRGEWVLWPCEAAALTEERP